MYKFDERKKSTFDNTDTCLPSPKNKYSPYVCRSKSNIDVQPFPSCLMKKESANSSMNSRDSLLNTDEAGDRTLGMGDRGQEFDPDMGYCSHSTSSSSHNMDQGTELDYCQSYPSDLSDVEGEGNGTDKMEDVVQQFGKYFQGQFHQLFHQFQSSVHCMLDEQQDHLRHIINFVTKCNQSGIDVHDFHTEQSSLPCEESAREQELHVGLTDKSCSLEEMDALPPLEDSDFSEFYWTNDMRQSDPSNSQISNFASSEYQSSMIPYTKIQETSKDRLLLHVFSLTSGVNNLLQKPEFKT